MGRTTDKIRIRIQRKEEKLNRALTESERRRIIKSVKRQVARENIIRGTFLAIGITIGAGGHSLLTEGKEKANEINKIQTETEVNNERNEFLSGLAVDLNTVTQEQNSPIIDSIETQVEALETKEDVLNYVKEIYVNEYNEQNNENFTVDQLSIFKAREGYNLYRDTAENGDTIIRSGYGQKSNVDTIKGVITTYMKDDDKIVKDQVINYYNEYKRIYLESQEVYNYEDNFLVDMASIIDTGIDWAVAIDEEGTSKKVKEEYKDRLIDAIADYQNKQKEQTSTSEILK